MRVPHSAARGWSLAARASSPCARLSRCSNYSSHSHLCCLPTTTYPDCRLYTSGSCTPGLSHTALLSLLYKDPHHNHPLLAQKAFVIALEWVVRTPRHAHHRAGHSPCPKRKPHAAPSTRLPQYSLDEEVRIVCYSPPLPKRGEEVCVLLVALAQCVATPLPLLLVVLFPHHPYKCAK